MDEFGDLRRFQKENEDEALAKALEMSQLKDSPTSSSLLLPSCEDLQGLQMQNEDEDQTLAKAMALSLETTGRTMGNTQSATPICLPNNHLWNRHTGRTTRTDNQRRSLRVVEEGLEQLRRVKGPVCVVSIAGPYRKGKSYILSKAFDQPEVFPLGHKMEAETMGIWIWIVPGKLKNSNGQELTVVLLDSEGIDATNTENTDDHQIFTLTVLLASVLIYNSQGVPTRSDVEKLEYP